MNDSPTRILLIDDNVAFVESTGRQLRRAGYEVATAPMPLTALEVLKVETFDIIVCDLRMPDMNGLELQKKAREMHLETAFVLATAFGDDETVAEMFRNGGVDYLKKPFAYAELLTTVKTVEEKLALKQENTRLRDENIVLRKASVDLPHGIGGIIAKGPLMRDIMARLHKVAPSGASVLLRGESGTGKEIIARAIHTLSPRKDHVFLSVNCGAIPETLLEAELFGHTKGAFTGAVETRKGLFEAANSGTLFLDEVGEIPLHLQVKLLRVLQENEIQRVGDPTPRPVDVRLVAATNRDLEAGVRDGWFRRDLFYRLNVIPLTLPPLRDRLEDLPVLIKHFLGKFSPDPTQPCRLSSEAMRLMLSYSYPGNIRELENAVEHAIILCEDGQNISPEALPLQIQNACHYSAMPSQMQAPQTPPAMPMSPIVTPQMSVPVSVNLPPSPPRLSLEDMERAAILDALRRSHFNRTKAADRLQITRRTLGYRIEKYHLEAEIEALKQQTEEA